MPRGRPVKTEQLGRPEEKARTDLSKQLKTLNERELFAAAWMLYLDTPLEADDFEGLWKIPIYTTKKIVHKDAFGFQKIKKSAILEEAPDDDGTMAYRLNRDSLPAALFGKVVQEAIRVSEEYQDTSIKDFLGTHPNCNARMERGRGGSLYEKARRIRVFETGVSGFGTRRGDIYYSETESDNPTGDADTMLVQQDAAILRSVAWVEKNAIRDGFSIFNKQDQKELLKYILADGIRTGYDSGWAYGRVLKDFDEFDLREYGAYRLGAYAFWRGRPDWIKSLLKLKEAECGNSNMFLQALLKEDVASAIGWIEKDWCILKNSATCYGFRDFPVLLLILATSIVDIHRGPMMKKIFAILHSINGPKTVTASAAESERVFNGRFLDAIQYLRAGIRDFIGTKEVLFSEKHDQYELLLLAALVLHEGTSVFGSDSGDNTQLLSLRDAAEKTRLNGYLSISATLYALTCRLFNQRGNSDCSIAYRSIREVGGMEFSGAPGGESGGNAWKEALEEFAKAVKPNTTIGRTKAADAGMLIWVIDLMDYSDYFVPETIGAAFARRKLKGEGYSPAVMIQNRRIMSGDFDAVMTPTDLKIKNMLVRDAVISANGKTDRREVKVEHMVALCEVGNMLMRSSRRGHEMSTKMRPITLVSAESRITLSPEGDGISLIVKGHQHSDPTTYRVLRRSSDCFEVRYCSEDFTKLAHIVNRFSGGGSLTIPAEGVAQFEEWLNRADRAMPFTTAGNRELAKKVQDALCEPIVRLRYASGELSVHLAVRISREPDIVAEPAAGLAERPIVGVHGERTVLKRDFRAEAEAVASIRKVLEPFGSERTEMNRWEFEGAEDSLDVLAALKTASALGAFSLEWPDGESLKLASLTPRGANFSSSETTDYWLNISGTFKLDDGKVISFMELLKNFDGREGSYVKLTDSRYLKLTKAIARRVESLKGAGIERNDEFLISPAALPSLEKSTRDVDADETLPLPDIVKERLAKIREAFAAHVREPSAFKCQMRPYQVEGYEWMSRLAKCGIGACLADDMGLGKTIQLIALLLARHSEGPSLVVAPASLVFNWKAEIERFAPSLKVKTVGQTPGVVDDEVSKIAAKFDVVITSYGVVSSREDQFSALEWNSIVLDEAQAIKNHLSRRSQSVRSLKAKFRVVATGTPIENRLTELWSLFDFINPGMLGTEAHFNKVYTMRGGEATPRLKRLVKPLILRRLKRDVLTDLPEKEEITLPVLLGDEERAAYEATRQNALAKLGKTDARNKIMILAELTRMRRFCCHPSLVLPEMQVSAKLDALEELLESLHNNNHRALIFSQFVDYLAIVRKRIEARGWSYKYLDGGTSKGDRGKSVEEFQSGEGDFFLISLKAGGMGLNLTAANYVILLDPWWNPAVENQAADRVHRIGQQLPVTVYRLIAKDTIEEKVVNLHAKKLALADDVLASGAASLSAEAMLSLLEN